MSSVKLPNIEYATTKGGDASQLAFTEGFILPSKFLLPDKTEHTNKSFSVIASCTSSLNGP